MEDQHPAGGSPIARLLGNWVNRGGAGAPEAIARNLDASSSPDSGQRHLPNSTSPVAIQSANPSLVPHALGTATISPTRSEVPEGPADSVSSKSSRRTRNAVDPDGSHVSESMSQSSAGGANQSARKQVQRTPEAMDEVSKETVKDTKESRRSRPEPEESVTSARSCGAEPPPESTSSSRSFGAEPPPVSSVNLSGDDLPSLGAQEERPRISPHPDFPPITKEMRGHACTLKPSVDGFDHPCLRGWVGPDQSMGSSIHTHHVVKVGYHPGIHFSHAGAWVRTADFKKHTRLDPVVKACVTCAEAVRFLGHDPETDPCPPILHRPPPRALDLAQCCGPDPHDWCAPGDMEDDSSAGALWPSSPPSESTMHDDDTPSAPESQPTEDLVDQAAAKFLALLDQGKLASDSTESAHQKSLAQLKPSDFPKPGKAPDPNALGKWQASIESHLTQPMWKVEEVGILLISDEGDSEPRVKTRHEHLCRLLVGILSEHHFDILQDFQDLVDGGRGGTLFRSVLDSLHPNSEATALGDFSCFVTRLQQSGETVTSLLRELRLRHRRLTDAGFPPGDRVLLLQPVRGVLQGAHGNTKEVSTFSNDILHQKLKLSDETVVTFAKKVQDVMAGGALVVDGEAKRLPAGGLARRTNGGLTSQPNQAAVDATIQSLNLRTKHPWIGQMHLTEPEVDLLFKAAMCPTCRIPRGAKGEHQMQDCPILKKRGTIGMEHDQSKDVMREARMRNSKNGRNPADKARRTTDTEPTETPATEPAEVKSVGGANRVAGQASRVVTSNPCDPLSASDDDESLHLDMHFDANGIKEHDSDSCMHGLHTDPLATCRNSAAKCTGVCRQVSAGDAVAQDTLNPDSGATSDMFNDRKHFAEDCKTCSNACVRMGDGSPVPVVGMGTVRFKTKDKIAELPNALHVPALDCNPSSITRHGLRGQGCASLVQDGELHLTCPGFTLSVPIPGNGDPRFDLPPLASSDDGHCDFSGGISFDQFGDACRRMWFVNRMHKVRAVTRSRTKQSITQQKKLIKSVFTAHGMPKPKKVVEPRSKTEPDLTEDDLRNDSSLPQSDLPAQLQVESSASHTPRKHTSFEMERFFGGRQLKDHSILSELGSGIRITDDRNDIPAVGRLANRKRGRRGKPRGKILHPRSVVGMDTGCGPAVSPGGHKHALALVDCCTTHTFVCGMKGTSGTDVQEALWRFFTEAGGFPKKIQCDFDPRFLGGNAEALLQSHGCAVQAAPPNRQSQNGLVEKRWEMSTCMARSHLTDAKPPAEFWFWAIREAATRLNMLPISSNRDNPSDPSAVTTPCEAFFGVRPDCRVLFPFGCLGSFRRTNDGPHKRNEFASQGMLGIALGRSEHTNGMIFHNPTLDSFSTSADFHLDTHRSVGEEFPNLAHDGGSTASVWSNREDAPTKFSTGEIVFVMDDAQNVQSGVIVTPPTSVSRHCTMQLDIGTTVRAPVDSIHAEHAVPATGLPSETLGLFAPNWMQQGTKVMCLADGEFERGCLDIGEDCFWEFVTRQNDGSAVDRSPLPDLNCTWKDRLLQGTMEIGWTEDVARRTCGSGRHVSAAHSKSTVAPANLAQGLSESDPDNPIWRAACDEECDGPDGLDAFIEIDEDEHQALVAECGDSAKAMPTVNLFTVKHDAEGNPVRAKSRIVVLGDSEKRVWEKVDRCAPVINAASNRLLASMAVEHGRRLKQGDCKNAFCQPRLPDSEITAVRPPKGCPRSKPGTHWRLKKTLCGLSRSPRHWHDTFSGILRGLGFKSMPQDPCAFEYQAEEWFEQELSSKLKADFVGPVSWFLGCHHDWHVQEDGKLSCHVSQQACAEQPLDKFGMEGCMPSNRLCKQGLPIDRVDRTAFPEDMVEHTRRCQSLMGGLTWLMTSTRPDMSVAAKLLSQFNCKPSVGHMDSAEHVLRCLKHTASHGIWFTQGESRPHTSVAFPDGVDPKEVAALTDADWGAQDASKPRPNKTRKAHADELNSIQGHCTSRMGGAMQWGIHREPRVSGSSCEAEIKAMDDGTKGTQFLRHLMEQLGLIDSDHLIPLLNDNRGAVDWANNGGILTKRLRHSNIREGRVAEAQKHGEIQVHWIPGSQNPADLFTKEHKDAGQFDECRDLMVRPGEWIHQGCPDEPNDPVKGNGHQCSTPELMRAKKEATKAAKKARRAQKVADSLHATFRDPPDEAVHFGVGNGGFPPLRCSLNRSALTPLSSLRRPRH